MDKKLEKIISDALLCSGCDEHSFTMTESDCLVDDEAVKSVLVDIKFNPYSTDDGRVDPNPITIQFDYDKDNNEYCFIVGEDTEQSITYGNLFATMYFYTMQIHLS